MNHLRSVFIVAVFGFVVSGCKKDEAELTADWNKHVDEVQKYSAKYPAFKTALDARLAEAQKTFDEAKAAAGDERGKKLAEANSRISDVFGPFTAYEKALVSLKTAQEKHAALPPSLAKLNEMAKATDAKAAADVAAAKPANIGEGQVTLEAATTLLKNASEAYVAADGYVKAETELKALQSDKEILNLPAGTVMPLIEGAKKAQTDATAMIAAAGAANPAEVKVKIKLATDVLAKAIEPLKKAKPAPAPKPAAPAVTVAKSAPAAPVKHTGRK